MLAPASLNACLLVRREHTVRIRQGRTLPEAFIEIKDTPSLLAEQGIPGKEPAAMVPGPDGILAEPAPDRGLSNGSDQSALNGLSLQISHAEPRQRNAVLSR